MPEAALTLGRYDCLCLLGRGGMAEVWAARAHGARGFQKLVALKMLLPAMLDDPTCERMFLDEASVASRIQHPNAVEVMDLGEEQGRLFIAMEYVDGASLSALSRVATLPLPLPLALEIVAAACFGLHAAHELKDDHGVPLGVVHRDVSPHNILIGRDGTVKVADFGIAKAMAKSSGTDLGVVKGKLSYMAPEQARGEHLDRRADVFALGVVLYELTTGVHPFRGESSTHTARKLLSFEWRSPREVVGSGYPIELDELVRRAMAPDAEARPASALELGLALEAVARSQSLSAAPGALAALVQKYLGPELERRAQLIRGTPTVNASPSAVALPRGAEAVTMSEQAPASAAGGAQRSSRATWLAAGLAMALVVTLVLAYSLFGGVTPLPGSPASSVTLAAAATVPAAPPLPSASPQPAASFALPTAPVGAVKKVTKARTPVLPKSHAAAARNVPVRDPGF